MYNLTLAYDEISIHSEIEYKVTILLVHGTHQVLRYVRRNRYYHTFNFVSGYYYYLIAFCYDSTNVVYQVILPR